jgi:DNA-binding MarR family transcriptional regulator
MSPEPEQSASARLCCATALRKASRRLTQLYDEALAESGLRSTQYAILAELVGRAKQSPTLQELADALVMDRSALGHNLRPLERDGLVVLREGSEDRRRRHIVITPRGKAKYGEARQLWQTAQDRFIAVFGERNTGALRASWLEIAHDSRLQAGVAGLKHRTNQGSQACR